MRFPEAEPSRSECLGKVSDALLSEKARVYVDASVLIHCYEVSRSACEELITNLEGLSARVRVPIWSAKETWEHTRLLPSRRPLVGQAGQIVRRVQAFRAESLRYVDERTFDDMTHEEYSRAVDTVVADVVALMRKAERIVPEHGAVNGRLLPFIERHTLASDMPAIYDEVRRTGETRFSHEVPPGFADGGQRPTAEIDGEAEEGGVRRQGKVRNRYGDLIMWLEALQDCVGADVDHLVILTRDNSKRDWAYKPERVLDDDGRPQQNGGLVTLPLPLLVQEARVRCARDLDVHVMSLEMFTQVRRTSFGARVGNLVRALQPQLPSRRSTSRADHATEAAGSGESRVDFGSRDMMYEPTAEEASQPVWRSIAALRAEGWTVRNAAAAALTDLIADARPTALKQIGRGIVAAARDDAIGPIDLASQTLENDELGIDARANVLSGMLGETYLDDRGEPVKPMSHPTVTELLFAYAIETGLRSAYTAVLEGALGPVRRLYLALPNEDDRRIRIEIDVQEGMLLGLRGNGVELIERDSPTHRRLPVEGGSVRLTADELLQLVAREFVVPSSMLVLDGPLGHPVAIPERMGFVNWGPLTGRQLR